ncbi:ell-associated factor Eaf-like [Sabethes cyaneus]|uniref:ell-associated factor Eaf-like n=1 Tax=Sabethes cyaneus TaxID=53552 RepID=UPI00237D348E|nr:ell-associated factor Eaf-like [Sabethes cyaneus]
MDNLLLGLGSEVRELKLGATFTHPSAQTAYHTLKYDFKPASVDVSKSATLEVGSNKEVTVTVPHLDGSGVPNTVFKGNQQDYSMKDCVLIIDHATGEITLERLCSNVQVKKTRTEGKIVQPPPQPASIKMENPTARRSSKTKVTTGHRKNGLIDLAPKHLPLRNSPYCRPNKTPQEPAGGASNSHQSLPSLPIIGMGENDFISVPPLPEPRTQAQKQRQEQQMYNATITASLANNNNNNAASIVEVNLPKPLAVTMSLSESSDSSSSSSESDTDSSSESDSSSEDEHDSPMKGQSWAEVVNHANMVVKNQLTMDLYLSESDSD